MTTDWDNELLEVHLAKDKNFKRIFQYRTTLFCKGKLPYREQKILMELVTTNATCKRWFDEIGDVG